MKLKDLERQIRTYVPITLWVKNSNMLLDEFDFDEVFDASGSLLTNVSLSKMIAIIVKKFPSAEVKFIFNGRVVDTRYTLQDLIDEKHIHENRTKDTSYPQSELIFKRLSEAKTYRDIDDWYSSFEQLLMRISNKNRRLLLLDSTENIEIKQLTQPQQEYVRSLIFKLKTR